MKKWQWLLIFLGAVLIGVGMGLLLKLDLEQAEMRRHTGRNLPTVEVELNGISLEDFKAGTKQKKYPDNEVVIRDGKEVQKYTDVELKGRGNSTWGQPKKPFQLKFKDSTDILGLGKGKKWVFLANHLDGSYLRTDIGFLIAEMLGADHVKRGKFVEVYFDSEYEGLYYVVHKIGVDKGSVGLESEAGLLMEMDNLHRSEDEPCYQTYAGHCLVLKDAVSEDAEVLAAAAEEFLADFDRLEIAAEEGNWAEVTEVADVDSLVKYYLINELTLNPDAYSSSFYWYKDGAEDKLHAGPVWDFDLSLANSAWVWSEDQGIFSPTELMPRRAEVFGENGYKEDTNTEKMFYYLAEMPEFQAEVRRVFAEYLAGKSGELLNEILREEELIREAALADTEKWERGDFEAEMLNLVEWIQMRYWMLERVYGGGGLPAA